MILVVGSITMDTIIDVQNIPQPGEIILATNVTKAPGGKGANQAVAASKSGGDIVMLGSIGNDANGELLLATLNEAGVNTEHVLRNYDVDTASAYICVSQSGENSVIMDSSATGKVTPDYLITHEDLFKKADYCVLQMDIPENTVKKAIRLCHRHGVKIVYNPSPLNHLEMSILKDIDYVVVNEAEAPALMGYTSLDEISHDDFIHFLRCRAIKHFIITMGAKGILHYDVFGNDAYYYSTPQVAVDTTGAGDAFMGAFVTAISSNSKMKEAITYANVAAGLTVTKKGAQASFPTKDAILSYIKKAHIG